MDDTAQNSVQNSKFKIKNSTQGDDAITQAQPVVATPISGSQKEAAPIAVQNTQEYLTPSEVEPVIIPEVAEHGVEAVANHHVPQLTPEHKAIGIEHAKETVQVSTVATGKVQLPTVEEATLTVKQRKVSDSIVWIASLVLKHAKLVHEKLLQSKS